MLATKVEHRPGRGNAFLYGLGAQADDEEHLAQEARLLYVGMTRARRRLLVTSSGSNWYATRLGEMVAA